MKNITLILLFTIPLLALKCNKDPEPPIEPIDQLPPATQTGENTFGCLVDGEVWLPRGSFNFPAIASSYSNGTFFLKSNKVIPAKDIKESFRFEIYDQLYDIGNYKLFKKNSLKTDPSPSFGTSTFNPDPSLTFGTSLHSAYD